jgi:hypothetical protein
MTIARSDEQADGREDGLPAAAVEGEIENVIPVDRRHERLVQPGDQLWV